MKYFLYQFKEKLGKEVAGIIGVHSEHIAVEQANPKFGADLAIPMFKYASMQKVSPEALAGKVVDELEMAEINKVDMVGGFVNIWLDTAQLARHIFADSDAVQRSNHAFGDNNTLLDQEIVVEYTDPNPFKEFHIGHAYSNTVGESISRLLEVSGANVHRLSYHGDVGMHIAKAMWGIEQILSERETTLGDIETAERAKFLGEAYALGAKAFEEDEAIQSDITQLNKQIYELDDAHLKDTYLTARGWSFEYFESIYKRLNVGFEKSYLESQAAEVSKKVVEDAVTSKVLEESDEAVVFKGEEYGLHTRVFVNSQGLPTYEAKDLGLALLKHQDFNYDRSIIITGNEQSSYFKVLFKVLELLKPELAGRSQHIGHGMVRLASGKMSSRTGDVITATWLLDTVQAEIEKRAPDSPSITENTLAAIKYAFLKQNVGEDIVFDVNESISLEGDSGVYVQYAAVRVASILRKIDTQTDASVDYDWQAEKALLWHLARYPEVVEGATEQLAPHNIAHYVYELAKLCNRYYETVSIAESKPVEQQARLALLEQIHAVYVHGLHLLGIDTPEKM